MLTVSVENMLVTRIDTTLETGNCNMPVPEICIALREKLQGKFKLRL